MTSTELPDTRRTAKAIAQRRRNSEERHATELQERGWLCLSPEDTSRLVKLHSGEHDCSDKIAGVAHTRRFDSQSCPTMHVLSHAVEERERRRQAAQSAAEEKLIRLALGR